MTRSGINKGLAASAVAALGIVGLPAAAHAAPVNSTDVSTITLSPSKASVSTSEATTYTITAKKADGTAATGSVHILVTVPGTPVSPATTVAGSKITLGADTDASTVADTDTATGWTQAVDVPLTNGAATLKVASDAAGAVKVAASSDAVAGAAANSTFTVGGGLSGNANVKNVALGASSVSAYVGEAAGTSVSLTDASGFGVSGADFNYQIDGTGTVYSGSIAGNGSYKTDVTLPALAAGAHTVKFWVNQTGGASSTPAADAGEPTSTLSVSVVAAPAVSSSTLVGVGGIVDGGNNNAYPSYQGATVGAKVTLKDSSSKPVAGVKVRFDVYAGAVAPSQFQVSLYGTTDANGVASLSAPISADQAKALAGSGIVVDSYVSQSTVAGQGLSVGHSTAAVAEFENAVNTITLVGNPDGEVITAAKGSQVSVNLLVADQFGKPAVGHVLEVQDDMVNANPVVTATNHLAATNAQGQTTYTYTDTKKDATKDDAFDFVDLGGAGIDASTLASDGYAYVDFVNSVTAASVNIDSGFPVAGAVPGGVAAGASEYYSVRVLNADGDALAHHSVTFSVDNGFVAAKSGDKGTAKSLTVTTDDGGYAEVYAGSKQAGNQTVTVTSDAAPALKGNVRSYAADAFYNLSVTPSGDITTGSTGKFTATASDEFGNPVALPSLTVAQSGAGALPNGTSVQALAIPASGSISFTVNGGATAGTGSLVLDAGVAAPTADADATLAAYTGAQTVKYNVVAPVKPPVVTPPVVVKHPVAISKVAGKSQGKKDVLTVKVANANGKKAVVKVNGKKVGTGVVKNGVVKIKVADKNGNKKTAYSVIIGGVKKALKLK